MNTIEDKLVFCIDCRWLLHKEIAVTRDSINSYDCRYPANVTKKNIWLASEDHYINKPEKLNQNNDCSWFAHKLKKCGFPASQNLHNCLNGE